jgi:hypothetical protein
MNKNKFIRNEFVLRSRRDKFDSIKFEQPKADPQGVTMDGWSNGKLHECDLQRNPLQQERN